MLWTIQQYSPSTASDCAPLQYIVPYAGTALAEYFMYKGKDVLMVYDDLSSMQLHIVHCHCFWNVHRDVRLILEMYSISIPDYWSVPAVWNEKAGGGSITALPIIETQQVTFPLIFLQTLFPSQMVRSSWRVTCLTPVCVRRLT